MRQARRDPNGSYFVEDVIQWFLSKDSMSPKKLQKLLYYAYAWTLTLQNEDIDNLDNRLFESNLEAWVHGPVDPETYHAYKEYGFHDIERAEEGITFDEEIEDVLNQVWDVYGGLTGNELESITHQETPWIQARGDCSPLERCRTNISDRDIFEYYIQEVEYDS